MALRILFTCGGTGGHINPAVAAAQRLRSLMPDCEILFVGVRDNMEMDLVPREGFPIRAIPAGNLHRSLKPREILHNLRSGAELAEGIRRAGRILKEFRPQAVLGTGGYVCCPVLIAASRMGVPTLLHEANALPGLTTRLLERHTDQLMVAFEESRRYYRHPEGVVCTGMPVRSGFRDRDRAQARKALGIPEDLPLVLSFGGSLGAKRMNEALAGVAAALESDPRFRLLHATGGGEEGLKHMEALLAERGASRHPHTRLEPYLYDMPTAMAAADLVVCRAGASTLGELAAAGKAAILIPYPYATGDHQEKNARIPEGRGAALLLRDADCTAESLGSAILRLTEDPETLPRMGKAMAGLDRPDAVDAITDQILRLIPGEE